MTLKKRHNSTMGDNSDKTNTDELFFMRNLKTLAYLFFFLDGRMSARTDGRA